MVGVNGQDFPDFLENDCEEAARRLLGCTLERELDGTVLRVRIVETEAYDMSDAAAHTHRGPTERNRAMFGPPGHAYVYFNYGLHWCLNFVCREEGHGAGVLIRALQPTHGLERMRARRGLEDERLLCAGPGRVGQALGIDKAFYDLPLDRPPFAVRAPDPARPIEVVAGPRIGITRAVEQPWRFGLAGSSFLSRRFP
jgi:DNA-3-methyladenine glycosylase